MWVEEEDNLDNALIKHREDAHKCTHPSKKCLVCGKAEDNLYNEQKAEIEVLYAIIAIQDQVLTNYHINHINTKTLILSGIIDIWKHDKIRSYEQTKRAKFPYLI